MHKLKFKAGDKVRIINRKKANTTGNYPKCYDPHGYEGAIGYIFKDNDFLKIFENINGTGEYFGIYSEKIFHFNDDDLELVEFVLPENWCVKVTEENKDIVHRWKLDNTSRSTFTGVGHYVESNGTWDNKVSSGHTEISFKQFQTHVLKQETKMVQKLTLAQLKDLYGESSCGDWRNRIVAIINDNILAKDDSLITIKDGDITYARQNASDAQLKVLKNAGIKFEEKPKYKVGDYVTVVKGKSGQVGEEGKTYKITNITDGCRSQFLYIGVSCIDLSVVQVRPATEEEITKASCPYKDGDLLLVKNGIIWVLRYSAGKLDNLGQAVCYDSQQKSGPTSSWSKHKLANITLDE